MTLVVLVLALVTLQRLGELALARRNTARLLDSGAVEVGAEHYPLIVVLHGAWLTGLWLLAPSVPPSLPWLAAFAVLQVLRLWVLASLGRRWTTRIVVLPGAPLVRRGPYRFMAHPNYAVVVGEIAVLPIAFGMYGYALCFRSSTRPFFRYASRPRQTRSRALRGGTRPEGSIGRRPGSQRG